MSKYALVVVGFNRIPGMLRLLRSLERADYGKDEVTLIISLDQSGSSAPEEAANAFVWSHGRKIVRTFRERQGLRKHILSCGDYLREYDAIAVFEDDLLVSPAFYQYMKQAVEHYKANPQIAGISLYNHKVNVNADLPFIPEPDENDVYFMQFAQSWGQIWLKEQWFEFRRWYDAHGDEPLENDKIPEFVSNWPETSWLKYHIKYCVAKDKYFVYPYDALTTCFSDAGEHCKENNTVYQIPMIRKSGRVYQLCEKISDGVCYDAFFERKNLGDILGVSEEELCTDLYGLKKNREGRRYWLTREKKTYKVLMSFGLCMRPHECNVSYGVEGREIYLYDTLKIEKATMKRQDESYKTVNYYYNLNVKWKILWGYFTGKVKRKLGK